MKKMICLTVCLMLAVLCMTGCGQSAAAPETAAPTEAVAASAETAAVTEPVSGVLENSQQPAACFEVETPYCMLTYPMTWQHYVMIEQEQTEAGCAVAFYCILDGKDPLRLFDVRFGGTEGDPVGQLQTGEGPVDVFFKTYSVLEQPDLSEDDKEVLLAMLEDINVIYTGLQALSQFN